MMLKELIGNTDNARFHKFKMCTQSSCGVDVNVNVGQRESQQYDLQKAYMLGNEYFATFALDGKWVKYKKLRREKKTLGFIAFCCLLHKETIKWKIRQKNWCIMRNVMPLVRRFQKT